MISGDVSITRRGWFGAAAASSLPVIALAANARGQDDELIRDVAPRDATEALAWLEAGNRRFVSGEVRHAHEAAAWRKHLSAGQHPFATILACSDSRVPPELVFDEGFGDLFVVRVAGNIVAPDVIGSLQYASLHLGTPLIVVMGHESCGAVTAALEALANGEGDEPWFVANLLASIEPGLNKVPAHLEGAERVHAGVEANVRWAVHQIESLPQGTLNSDEHKCTLVGAIYDINTGKVRFLE